MTNDAPISEVRNQCQQWRDENKLYHCEMDVRWSRNDRTHEIEVTAHLGCAPDATTVILYPVSVYRYGYWNKTHTRQQMTQVKLELLALMDDLGFTKRHLTRPI